MKEITQENYQQLEYNWEGIIIAYPKVDLYWNAEFYVYKQELNEKNEYIYKCCGYSKEDSVYDGFSGDWSKKDFESCFGNWDKLTYYQFKDLKDFCKWYLHKDDKLHESIDKFIKDTDKFYTKTKSTRREKYKDIIELFKYQHELSNLENQLCEAEITKDISKIEDCKMLLEIGKENFSRWLDSEVE